MAMVGAGALAPFLIRAHAAVTSAGGGGVAGRKAVRSGALQGVSTPARAGFGVVVDDQLRTGRDGLFALGECAEHRGVVYGLVAPLYQMARVCAAQLAGVAVGGYRGWVPETRLKVSGIEVCSCGDFP